jgi:hypothetical protein
VKIWDCQYFKDIFINIPLNEDLVVLEKQQYYISFCYKVCKECLETLHLKCPHYIKCPICEAKQDINYVIHIRWIFNMSTFQGFKIQIFHEFHDIYGSLQDFFRTIVDLHHQKDQVNPLPL